ncbi:HAMP domain-containing histidine kinase [Nostoc muscorum FACHB-395]|uniref:HAMP domain-containing sensor histidine kinase n=1 Tax=Nostoc sp. C057 TaxID=2576903 RepID=UPI0015C2CFBC|nr:HAMP domain-containing histidine kinase [Nostoc sp. C057]MBD2508388.1 HAMP domain-containing histidine kinase [Desmonostoc muscorum FACHB-395]QLE48901.1 HAMP domain-containing histidine kinase [Nostoc sp. C057]
MFQRIRYRLLLSYLVVFASLLGIFAIAVRFAFTRSLTEQITDKLTAIGKGASANVEFEKGRLTIESDFRPEDLIASHQALQWFDSQGNLITQQGKTVLTLPFLPNKIVQVQTGKIPIQAVNVPIIASDNGELVGYVRVSQSLDEFDETLQKLDWGLGGGIIITLVLSGIGGILLTRQAMQPIEESFARLKQFTADASHELRSPLMAIKINAELPLEYPEEIGPKDAEKFRVIANATNQMTRLTEDLLMLARTDRVSNQDRDTLDLTSILENLIQLYKPQAEAKQLNLKIQLIANLQLIGDSVQLMRLFTNLIENALYYTPSGGVVEIKTSRVGSQLYVNLQDTGVGIAPEYMDKVFERFWRADQSRSYWSGGSGLGLAIAQTIAQNHGGLISVKSQLGIGSCFTVRLPTS